MKAEAVGARGARGILSSDALASYEAEVFSTFPASLASIPSPAPDFHESSAIALTALVGSPYWSLATR